MNTTSASIDSLLEAVADEAQFPSRMGHRDPGSPAFIFFDDDRSVDPELKAFQDDLLAFEEWAATTNFDDTREVEVGMFTVKRDIHPWDESVPDSRTEAHLDRQESRRFANWLIDWHKRRPQDNDRYHRVLRSLALNMDDDIADQANPVLQLKAVLQGRIKYAPGPVDGTIFVNPDGSRYKTQGTDPGKAKASFRNRHNLTDELVTIERVQYAGKRTSQYVVGIRKNSAETPSSYYDPEPAWKDMEGGSYAPRACALFKIGPALVMPTGSHRLSIREFEQALIAGADCFDDADEALADSMESDCMAMGADAFEDDDEGMRSPRIADGRIRLVNMGYGDNGRIESSFTEEEDYLMGVFRMIQDSQAQELMLSGSQEPNMIHRHFMSGASYDETVVGLLQFVARDNPAMLQFVTEAICGDEAVNSEMVCTAMDAVPPLFDDYEDSIPTGPNGACRRPAHHAWK